MCCALCCVRVCGCVVGARMNSSVLYATVDLIQSFFLPTHNTYLHIHRGSFSRWGLACACSPSQGWPAGGHRGAS